MRIKEVNERRNSIARRVETNEQVRVRFEKEAHDRERLEIQAVVDGYNKWREYNSIRQLM